MPYSLDLIPALVLRLTLPGLVLYNHYSFPQLEDLS